MGPAEDIVAYRHLPIEHERHLHSTNPLERLNKEIRWRSTVGIVPNPAAAIRLVGVLDRAGRRVGGGRASLLQRRIDAGGAAAGAVGHSVGDLTAVA